MPLRKVFYLLLGAPLIAVVAFATLQPIKVLPRITLAPAFALTDQDGLPITNEDLRGQIVLYNFAYSNCGIQCDQSYAVMQTIQDQLTGTGEDPRVSLITVSIDSDRDSPETLRTFAGSLGADPNRWRFASGDPEPLKWMIGGGFGIFYESAPNGQFEFEPAFMLVDWQGILRAEYRTPAPAIERIIRDINLLEQETRNSKGSARYAYEAAHLFLCYPR